MKRAYRLIFSFCLLFTSVVFPALAQTPGQIRTSSTRRSSASAYSLPRSTPEKQGISSSALLDFVDKADKEIDQMNSFIIVRHGYVIAEGWWAPYDPETPHVLYSLSKSFTSTAVGLAVTEGKLSLDDEILKFFPDEVPAQTSANLKAMRVRDLLRMSSGNGIEPPIFSDTLAAATSSVSVSSSSANGSKNQDTWTRKFLSFPVFFKPGTHFLYNSAGTYMLSAIVQKVTGMTVLDYLRPRLFQPLGFKDPKWDLSPQGISAGAFGLNARTEEIARFGQLYLQKGRWKGRQLIPMSWVEEATKIQTANGSSPNSDWDQGYGYQFWRSRHNTYRGDGAFGQFCMVIPQLDAVVAITSGVRDMQSVMNLVWNKLLPEMKTGRLPENAVAKRKLEARLASLAVRLPAGETSASLGSTISGRWYRFPENDRGIEAISFDFTSASPTLAVRTTKGERRTPVGIGSWTKSQGGFSNGLDRFLSVPAQPLMAASGAWSAPDTFTVKLVLYETPYYSTLKFRFDGERLVFDAEHNVSFGPTKLPQLVGQLDSAK